MRNTLSIALILAAAAATPVAFAQDNTSSNATPHRWNATIGYAHQIPKTNPGNVAGSEADLDGSGAATVSGSWFATDNIAVELWGADKFEQDVNLSNGTRGRLKQQPIAVSGQYHFGQAAQPIRPYVGLGYYQANIDSESFDPTVAGGQHVGFSTPKGAIASAGVDFNVTDRWFARADARYMYGDSDVSLNGNRTGESLRLDPWVVGVGIGTRF
ncbi:outer membrane beta-barrel protein [Lysobacter sp. KIS68-7]|uniref:OmpW/AlkL family protein n=1 Tax=Lysobacter sp. KIS68-7 TaxID=2904252 RepID=UPI001E43A0AC|nr:OmpW family outer membrane protein [Lysobacter sp. KIS68-7]UHQ20716.1 outer membrane beta-barrel protein [Lysobacter sp. KIS68-7]